MIPPAGVDAGRDDDQRDRRRQDTERRREDHPQKVAGRRRLSRGTGRAVDGATGGIKRERLSPDRGGGGDGDLRIEQRGDAQAAGAQAARIPHLLRRGRAGCFHRDPVDDLATTRRTIRRSRTTPTALARVEGLGWKVWREEKNRELMVTTRPGEHFPLRSASAVHALIRAREKADETSRRAERDRSASNRAPSGEMRGA